MHRLGQKESANCTYISSIRRNLVIRHCFSSNFQTRLPTIMPSKQLSVIQAMPLKSGSPAYEAFRTSMLQEFGSNVPQELRLPQPLIDNPPKDVTGIPSSCGILSNEELEITENYDATALAAAIASRKFTAVAVVTAFSKRAIIAHQLTCCLTQWFMEEAVQAAQLLDNYLTETGKTVGPLHGVPISIKEHMPIKNQWASVGFLATRRLDKEDCQMTAILRQAGAIFYCKTNQPQAIMHLETTSPWGRTLNPLNINLSAGGSTGGEAALIALRGSVLGVGTDIGGSVRGPAGFCGIYGLKTTSYLFPQRDFLPGGFAAELNILCSAGPMCTTLRDVDLLMSVISNTCPWLKDPRLIPIPWNSYSAEKKSLKIGIMMTDGVITPQPPVMRALKWALSELRSKGFDVKTFQPYQTEEAMKNIRLAYWPDGGKAVKGYLEAKQEPMHDLTQWIIKDAEGPGLDTSGILKLRVARDDFRCRFAEHWESQDVDFVICPVFVGPACSHETAFYWNYTAFWNYVDYPGIVIPTPVKAGAKGSEDYPADSVPLSKDEEHVRMLWSTGDFEGAPINLQIVARKYHDNDLFAAATEIDKAINHR
jgi:amidase